MPETNEDWGRCNSCDSCGCPGCCQHYCARCKDRYMWGWVTEEDRPYEVEPKETAADE